MHTCTYIARYINHVQYIQYTTQLDATSDAIILQCKYYYMVPGVKAQKFHKRQTKQWETQNLTQGRVRGKQIGSHKEASEAKGQEHLWNRIWQAATVAAKAVIMAVIEVDTSSTISRQYIQCLGQTAQFYAYPPFQDK